MFMAPITSSPLMSGTMMIACSSTGVPGIWIRRGSPSASLRSTGSRCSTRPPGQALPLRDREAQHGLRIAVAGKHGGARPRRLVDPIDAQVVVPDHALQAIGDELEHAGRLERREEALVDLEQAPLRVGLARQRGRLLAELLVEARVGDRDRRLAGEHLEQLGIGGVERVARLGVDGERADRAVLADERGAHDRPDAVLADVAVGRLGVREVLIGQVVAGADHSPLDDGAARDALVQLAPGRSARPLDREVDGRVAERPVQAAGLGDELDAAHRRRRAGARPRRGFAAGRRPARESP